MLKKIMKNIGEGLLIIISFLEMFFGIFCMVIYSLNPDNIPKNYLGIIMGFIIALPGVIYLFILMIKYPKDEKKNSIEKES